MLSICTSGWLPHCLVISGSKMMISSYLRSPFSTSRPRPVHGAQISVIATLPQLVPRHNSASCCVNIFLTSQTCIDNNTTWLHKSNTFTRVISKNIARISKEYRKSTNNFHKHRIYMMFINKKCHNPRSCNNVTYRYMPSANVYGLERLSTSVRVRATSCGSIGGPFVP